MQLPFPEFRRKADQWTSRNLFWIALGGFVVGCFLFGMVNYYGDKAEQAVATNPMLPKSEAKAIIKAARKDSIKAEVFGRAAVKAILQADTARAKARKYKRQADSLRTRYEAPTPTATGATATELSRRLADYQSPRLD